MPVDGTRIGLAEALSSRFKKNTINLVDATKLTDSTAKVIYNYEDDQITSDWAFCNGEWDMSNFSALSMRDMSKSGVATSFGYSKAVMFGFGFPLNDLSKMSYTITYEYTMSTFLMFGLGVSKSDFVRPYLYWDHKTIPSKPVEKDTSETIKHIGTGMHAGLQLPVKLGNIYLIPNVKGYFGIGFVKEDMTGWWRYSFGLNGAYKLRRSTYLVTGVQYKSLKIFGEDYARAKPHLAELVLGITF